MAARPAPQKSCPCPGLPGGFGLAGCPGLAGCAALFARHGLAYASGLSG